MMRLAERELQRQACLNLRHSEWMLIRRHPFKYVWLRYIVSPIVRAADYCQKWNKDRIVSKLLAHELNIPIELAHALGQDETGKCYLDAKKKLLAQGHEWTERPIQIIKTLDDLRRERKEKQRRVKCE